MSYATIRAALATRLQGIAGIGQVSTYERFSRKAAEDPEFIAKFVKNGILNSWWIDREAFPDKRIAGDTIERRHALTITGVYAFNGGTVNSDGTEEDGDSALVFQDLLETVADDLNFGDRMVGVAILMSPDTSDIRITSYQANSIRVHTATIKFEAVERRSA